MDDIEEYIEHLEEQCRKWEQLYLDVSAERDQLKQQLDIAMNPSAMTEKVRDRKQLRHV